MKIDEDLLEDHVLVC